MKPTRTALSGALIFCALTPAAMAQELEISTEGEITFGVNDRLNNQTYLIGEAEFTASQDFANGFGWRLSYEIEGEDISRGEETDFEDTLTVDLTTPIGTLTYGGINKKGASELFYNDLPGMAFDVVRYKDKYPSLRWKGAFGNFGYAISSRDLRNDAEEHSVGLGYETDRLEIGLSWDSRAGKQVEARAATLAYRSDLNGTDLTYTLSYIDSDKGRALGFSAEAEFANGWSALAAYAIHDAPDRDNGYAVEIGYEKDGIELALSYEFDGKDEEFEVELEYERDNFAFEASYEIDGGDEEYEIALSYLVEGFAPAGTTFYAGYTFEEGKPKKSGAYAAVGFGLAENAVFGIGWADTTESEGLELRPGWSALLNVSF